MTNDQVSSLCFILIGLIVVAAAGPLGIGSISAPGSGFVPLLSGAGMCLFGGVGLVEATLRRRKGEHGGLNFKNVQWQKSLMTLSGLVIYAVFLKSIGYLVSTTLLMFFLLRFIIPQRWSVVFVGAVLISVGSFLIFKVWLHVQLPGGVLGF